MKKIEILCVGKIKENYFKDAIAEYQKRLSRFCSFSIIEVAEFGDSTLAKDKEGAAILQKMLDGSFTILLDIQGEMITSEGLAKAIDLAFVKGNDKVRFIIGGSHGVREAVKERVDRVVSFGKITYPHQLFRVVLCEQIYRALCIQNGTPYHK